MGFGNFLEYGRGLARKVVLAGIGLGVFGGYVDAKDEVPRKEAAATIEEKAEVKRIEKLKIDQARFVELYNDWRKKRGLEEVVHSEEYVKDLEEHIRWQLENNRDWRKFSGHYSPFKHKAGRLSNMAMTNPGEKDLAKHCLMRWNYSPLHFRVMARHGINKVAFVYLEDGLGGMAGLRMSLRKHLKDNRKQLKKDGYMPPEIVTNVYDGEEIAYRVKFKATPIAFLFNYNNVSEAMPRILDVSFKWEDRIEERKEEYTIYLPPEAISDELKANGFKLKTTYETFEGSRDLRGWRLVIVQQDNGYLETNTNYSIELKYVNGEKEYERTPGGNIIHVKYDGKTKSKKVTFKTVDPIK
jgi:hypothetical protein